MASAVSSSTHQMHISVPAAFKMITSTTLHLKIYLYACAPPLSLRVQMHFHGHESHVQKTPAKLKHQKCDWNNKQTISPREASYVLFVRKRIKKSKDSHWLGGFTFLLWVAIMKLLIYVVVYIFVLNFVLWLKACLVSAADVPPWWPSRWWLLASVLWPWLSCPCCWDLWETETILIEMHLSGCSILQLL